MYYSFVPDIQILYLKKINQNYTRSKFLRFQYLPHISNFYKTLIHVSFFSLKKDDI